MYTLESNALCRRLINAYIAANNLESSVVVLDKSATELTAQDINFNEVTIDVLYSSVVCQLDRMPDSSL